MCTDTVTHTQTYLQLYIARLITFIFLVKKKCVMPIKTSLTIRKYYNVSCILYCIQYGDTILYKACSRGDQCTVDLLIKVGANIDIVNNVSL